MTATAFMGIRDAAAGALAGILAAERISANRAFPLADGVASDIRVYRVRTEADNPAQLITGAPIDWRTRLRIVVRARATSGASAEDAADALMAACYAALLTNSSFVGLVAYVVPDAIDWDQDEADSEVASGSLDVLCVHRTNSNAIT